MAKDLMSKEIVMFDVDAKDRNEVINLIADAMDKDGRLIDKEGYVADVMKREAGSSTAVGFSVATPHSKSPPPGKIIINYKNYVARGHILL